MQHVAAFKEGILEALREAFHPQERQQFRPARKARPRLRGLGVTTCISGVRLEVAMSKQEQEQD